MRTPDPTPVASLERRRGRLPHRRHQGRGRGPLRRDRHVGRQPRAGPRGLPTSPEPMVFCGLYPVDGDEFSALREALEKLRLNDSSLHLRARDLRRPRLRVPLRLPRPAPHGDRPRAPRAGVQPRPHRHRPVGGVHRQQGQRRGRHHRQPERAARRPPRSRTSRSPTSRPRSSRPPTYTGTLMELCQQRRGEMVKMEYLSPERMELIYRHAAGRGRHGLLRPDEEPHPGLRQPRLRAVGLPPLEPGQGRHPAQRACRSTPSRRSCTRTRRTTTASA